MFGNVFGKDISQIGSDLLKFRESVLAIAKKQYPENAFSVPSNDPEVIVVKGVHIGLQNLRAKFQQSSRSQAVLEELVKEHFALVLRDIGKVETVPNYEVAKTRIRLQLMPKEYGTKAPLVSFPFSDGLLVGLVLDSERGYLYLRKEDATRWGKEPPELRKVATENLDTASKNIPAHSANNEGVRFIALETKDGFDAARILLSGFRQFVGEQIGKPFYFAIPNRDFLICWSSDSGSKFQTFVREKVRKDFAEQPYPLSPNIFRVTTENEIMTAEQGAPVDAPKAARH
jgi:uncharacterized protein YtpQ (UPF0354 family)